MEFEARQDIAAPQSEVFRTVTDFSAFERQVLRRGAEVRRTDSLPMPQVGNSWEVNFMFRGRERRVELAVVQIDAPNAMVLDGRIQGLDFRVVLDLMSLSRTQTRMTVKSLLTPRTLTARLLLQSLRLARGNLTRRFEGRIEQFARDIETRHARAAGAVPR